MPLKPSTRSRTWGTRFDSLDSSPPTTPQTISISLEDIQKRDQKPSHDASVFVGSLPANVEHDELISSLHDHLADCGEEIKSVKIVRDIRGAVCAFVQLADAAAATRLLETLKNVEQTPFMGRTLRFEPARAFRTLLISYRTPTQWVANDSGEGKSIPLDLPWAMRIWRNRSSKFSNIAWNEAATEQQSKGAMWNNQALHLQPLCFDAEALESIASYFGPLEWFRVTRPPGVSDHLESSANFLPYPHDGPRNAGMTEGCFEVKWAHRDDCVAALMALRRVPHVTVSWAHQHDSQGNKLNGNLAPPRVGNASAESFNTWPVAECPSLTNSACTSQYSDTTIFEGNQTRLSKGWSDTDFPPLGDLKNERKIGCGVWGEKKDVLALKTDDENQLDGPICGIVRLPPGVPMPPTFDIAASPQESGERSPIPDTPALVMSPITPDSTLSLFTPTSMSSEMPIISVSMPEGRKNYEDETMRFAKEVDPTTLFVGGLETQGPTAWNEEKLTSVFSQYAGLESIRVVKPATGNAGFAFVKFNNSESPALAVREQHNRVYEGRPIRVQFRDVNPTRAGWKINRGRGRVQHGAGHWPRHYPDDTMLNETAIKSAPALAAEMIKAQDEKDTLSVQVENALAQTISELDLRGSPDSFATGVVAVKLTNIESEILKVSSPRQPAATDAQTIDQSNPNNDQFQEWYEINPEPNSNPPDSTSLNGSGLAVSSASPFPYPIPPGPYYTPWIPPYHQYGYPYYPAYPSYAFPGNQTSAPEGGPTPPMWQPMGPYGAYIPYPSYPPRPTNLDQPSAQPPVVPTGFIQNEQGTLIAVYPPEAIDQYMSGSNSGHSSPVPPNASVPSPTVAPPSLPQQANPSGWNQLPQPPPYNNIHNSTPRFAVPSTRPYQPPAMQLRHQGWMATSQSSVSLAPPQPMGLTASTSMPLPPAANFFRPLIEGNNHLSPNMGNNRRSGGHRRDTNNFNSRGRGAGRRGRGGHHSPVAGAMSFNDGIGRPVHFGHGSNPEYQWNLAL